MGKRRNYCAIEDLYMENCTSFILTFMYCLHGWLIYLCIQLCNVHNAKYWN